MPDRPQSFPEVVAAAVADLTENGFTDMERVERWSRLIREAAARSMVRPESLDQQLRDGLAAIYAKMVERDGLLRYHPGVERYTYQKIKPQLRGELDRRIMASANLIKLNREQAIDKTIQRFQGWATSVPPGGVSGEKRSEVKANVRKSLARLPFEERRVLIDQGHKLVGTINEVIAADGGAIAVLWRSHYRQLGYNYREDHRERDGLVYLIRDSWAHRAGLVRKGPKHAGPANEQSGGAFYDEIEAFGQLPFCRCYGLWRYSLRDLREDMLTANGKTALAEAKTKTSEFMATSRMDSNDVPRETLPKVGIEGHRMRLQHLKAML